MSIDRPREEIWQLLWPVWAKTARGQADVYHPLLCHLLDVGAVARSIVGMVWSTADRERAAESLNLSANSVADFIGWLAALHDIGKLSPWFLHQASAVRSHPMIVAMVRSAGFPTDRGNYPHGCVTAGSTPAVLQNLGLRNHVARRLARLVGSHHGIVHDDHDVNEAGDLWRLLPPQYRDAQMGAVELLHRLFEAPPLAGVTIDAPLAVRIAGVTVVADWIGANTQFFPPATRAGTPPASNPETYLAGAGSTAERALEQLGWLLRPQFSRATFGEVFPFNPRPLQQRAEELAPLADGLSIIEAPMGDGKTEAAFYLAHQLHSSGRSRGFYLGLPTRASSEPQAPGF